VPPKSEGRPGQGAPHGSSPAATIPEEADSRYDAIEAAGRGWSVFPCVPGSKRPAVDRWEQRATADPDRVARYWPSPRHNVGIACGPSNLVVIDLDTHGVLPDDWKLLPGIRDGRDVLAQLCEWACQPWPATYLVGTPSGGWHLYYRAATGSEIRNSASKLGPLVDVRASGGYVVAVGSAVDGVAYQLFDGQPAAPLPLWLLRLLTPQPSAARPTMSCRATPARMAGLAHTVESAAEGQRNSTLHWAACRAAEMIAVGEIAEPDATATLTAAAAAAGLPGCEASRTIASALRGGTR
jgi:hypothetical protein